MDKLFCKNCKYHLTIRKTSNFVIVTIHEPQEFVKLNYDESTDYDLYFDRESLINYLKELKKISKEDKQNKLDLYDKIKDIKKSTVKYILKCLTCSSEYLLEPETTIYSINYKKQNFIFDDDNVELKINDSTLPRTKDYKCDNPECITHKQNNADKEAVFYRALNSYHLKYACVVCKHSWFI
jgi:hypothetical protein